jgi:hypothetical protein
LKHLKDYLERRKSMLPDAEQVVTTLSSILDLQVKRWTGGSTDRQDGSESLAADNVVYVVNCPGVHSFTLEELQNLSPDKTTQDVSEVSRLGHLYRASNPSTRYGMTIRTDLELADSHLTGVLELKCSLPEM